MIVSSGLGLSHLPVRFLVPPEIAIVNFSGIST
jgi:predicted MPP superfamily phosphohydrolase